MTRVAIYARSATDSPASIEEQQRACREYAARQGWTVARAYSDRASSGVSLVRPGIQTLLQDAQADQFDVVLAGALDRVSRDQTDIAMVYKRLRLAGVQLITLAEGEISERHVGLKRL